MTHDELLAKIDPYGMDDYGDYKTQYGKALRAVVELHKVLLVKNYENDTDWYSCQACGGTEYPCETIQAIEKELG
jgi:hypothetical protein